MVKVPAFDDTPAAVHPETDEIERDCLQWMTDVGLLEVPALRERWQRDRLGEFSTHAYPYATTENAKLYARWNSWWFYFDQMSMQLPYHHFQKIVADLERIFWKTGAQYDATDPVKASFAQLCRETASCSPPAVYHWLQVALNDSMDGLCIESSWRHTQRLPSVGDFSADSEYILRRRKTIGTVWCTAFIEHSIGFTLPPYYRYSTLWQNAFELVWDAIIYQNDLNGAAQDMCESEVNNAVYLIYLNNGGDLHEAEEKVADAIRGKIADFYRAERTLYQDSIAFGLTPEEAAHACDIAHKLKILSQGALAWYRKTDRYCGEARSIFQETTKQATA